MLSDGFLNDKGNSSEQSLCRFSFFLFIFFPPNNLIQHSVNSDNMCIFFFFLHGWQNNHFAAVASSIYFLENIP